MSPQDKQNRTSASNNNADNPPPFLSLPRSRSGTTSSIQSINSIATLCLPSGTSGTSQWSPFAPGSARWTSMARYGPQERSTSQSRRPSLMSIKSLNGPSSSGTVSKTSVRGVASRSWSTPLSSAGGLPGWVDSDHILDSTVSSPTQEIPTNDYEEDRQQPTATTDSRQYTHPDLKQRSPLEKALLHSLEMGSGDSKEEQHTLRTFVDSRRETLGECGPSTLADNKSTCGQTMPTIPPSTEAVPTSTSAMVTDDRPLGEELSKSIGRHSIETFRTAHATPLNGSIREKVPEQPTVETEEPLTSEDMVVEQEAAPTATMAPADSEAAPSSIVWRLGTWVYSSIPSIGTGGVPTGDAASERPDEGAGGHEVRHTKSIPDNASPADGLLSAGGEHGDESDLPRPVANEAATLERTDDDPAPVGTRQMPLAPAGWGDTFRWRKTVSSPSLSKATSAKPKPEYVQEEPPDPARDATVGSDTTAGDSQSRSLALPSTQTTPPPDSTISPIEGGVRPRSPQQGWTSYFRSSLVRDSLVSALLDKPQVSTQVEILPGASSFSIDAVSVADPLAKGNADINAATTVGPNTSSRWWFRKTASDLPDQGPTAQTDGHIQDNTHLAGTTPSPRRSSMSTSEPSCPDPKPSRLSEPHPPRLNAERTVSSVARKSVVVPSWSTTFGRPPRSGAKLSSSDIRFTESTDPSSSLPKVDNDGKACWNGIKRIVIIGVHGWFPNTHIQK